MAGLDIGGSMEIAPRKMTEEEQLMHDKLTQAMEALGVVESRTADEKEGLWLSDIIAELDEMRADLRRIGQHPSGVRKAS